MQVVAQQLNTFVKAYHSGNGQAVAEILRISRLYHQGQIPVEENERVLDLNLQKVESPFDQLLAAHYRCIGYLRNRDWIQAFDEQHALVTGLIEFWKEESSWILPILYQVSLDLRLCAQEADQQLIATNKAPCKLEIIAGNCLRDLYRLCTQDRQDLESSKKLGTLYVINTLFKIYAQLKNLRLMKNLIKPVEHSSFPDLSFFPYSHTVPYCYFTGQLSLFNGEYKKAARELQFAFENCPKFSPKNKQQILSYLIPARMLCGVLPSQKLLEKYKLPEMVDLTIAIKQGNLRLFESSLEKNQLYFVRKGIFLILQRLRLLVYRNLFKKVFLLTGDSKFKLDLVQIALKSMQFDISSDEIECLAANLIFERYIKGYISHAHKVIVLSKQEPFANLKTLLKE